MDVGDSLRRSVKSALICSFWASAISAPDLGHFAFQPSHFWMQSNCTNFCAFCRSLWGKDLGPNSGHLRPDFALDLPF